MLDLLVPEYRFRSLTFLTPAWLRRNRYEGIILDLDNTFLRRDSLTPDAAYLDWIRILRSGGIAVVLVSNNGDGAWTKYAASRAYPSWTGPASP